MAGGATLGLFEPAKESLVRLILLVAMGTDAGVLGSVKSEDHFGIKSKSPRSLAIMARENGQVRSGKG